MEFSICPFNILLNTLKSFSKSLVGIANKLTVYQSIKIFNRDVVVFSISIFKKVLGKERLLVSLVRFLSLRINLARVLTVCKVILPAN